MRHNIVSLKLKYNHSTTEYGGIFFTVLTVEQNQWYCATLAQSGLAWKLNYSHFTHFPEMTTHLLSMLTQSSFITHCIRNRSAHMQKKSYRYLISYSSRGSTRHEVGPVGAFGTPFVKSYGVSDDTIRKSDDSFL